MVINGVKYLHLMAARMGHNRDLTTERLKDLGDLIYQRADVEEAFL